MRLLLDTHALIWLLTDNPRLDRRARESIAAAESVFVSAVSIWEIAIKQALGKIDVRADHVIAAIPASGLLSLPVEMNHAAAVAMLPLHHRDPFDRLLVAQAMLEPLRLLTADPTLARYSENVQII